MTAAHVCTRQPEGDCTSAPTPRLLIDGVWYCPKHAPKTCHRNCTHPDRRWDGRCSWCGDPAPTTADTARTGLGRSRLPAISTVRKQVNPEGFTPGSTQDDRALVVA